MGARADDAQRRVARQRQQIERRIEGLGDRARDDLDQAGTAARERVRYVADQAPGLERVTRLAARHPLTTVGGALGLGVALGVASEGIPLPISQNNQHADVGSTRGRMGRAAQEQGDQLRGAVAPIIAGVVGPMQDELRSWFREAIRGASDGQHESERPSG